jgi:hypothetical protein
MAKKRKKTNQGLSRITFILIAVAVLLLLALGAAYFIYARQSSNANANVNVPVNQNVNKNTNTNLNKNTNTNTNTNVNTNTNLNTNTAVADPTAQLKGELRNLAINFTEVFGSYSNQSDFENIQDLHVFMTAQMAEWADSYVESALKNQPSQEIYYGITTIAVSAKLSSLEEEAGTAEFLVTCQRKESTGSAANSRIFYQDNIVKMEQEGSVWKVSGSYWQ